MMVGMFFGSKINGMTKMFPQTATLCIPQFAKSEVMTIDPYRGDTIAKVAMSPCVGFPLYELPDMLGDWDSVFKACCKFLRDNAIDTMLIVGLQLFSDFKRGLEKTLIKKTLNKFHYDKRYSMNFNMKKHEICKLVFEEACFATCKNVYHYVLDPQEPHLDHVFSRYKPACYRRLTFVRTLGLEELIMPFYEYGLNDMRLDSDNNQIRLFFRGSAMNKDRHFLLDYGRKFGKVEGCRVKVFTKAQGNAIPQDYYFFLLMHSRYTMVVTPYDRKSFSWLRFVEALMNGCLPLVHDSCSLEMLDESIPDVSKIIKEYLMFSTPEEIDKKMKDLSGGLREEVIECLLDTDTFRKFLDPEWLSSRWSRLRGLGGSK